MMNPVLIEGYNIDEILSFSDELLETYLLNNEPMVFKAGTAEILGCFRITNQCLVIELAQIEGGGEGVLPSLYMLAKRYAMQRELNTIEWIIHAVTCAKPNLKLRRILQLRGFVVEYIEGVGECYHLIQAVTSN